MCTSAPNIRANFGTTGEFDRYGTINFDSGAIVSYIHDSMITHSDYVVTGPRTQEFYGAGGDRLKLKPFVIDIKVNVGNKGVYEFKNVLVATSDSPSSTMLVGQSDLERLGIDISFARRTVTFGHGALQGVPLPMEQNWISSINPIKQTTPVAKPGYTHHEYKLDAVGTVGADSCKVEECCVNQSKRQKAGEQSDIVPLGFDAESLLNAEPEECRWTNDDSVKRILPVKKMCHSHWHRSEERRLEKMCEKGVDAETFSTPIPEDTPSEDEKYFERIFNQSGFRKKKKMGIKTKTETGGLNKNKVLKNKEVEWSSITTQGKLRTSVGVVGFLARFLKRYSDVHCPIERWKLDSLETETDEEKFSTPLAGNKTPLAEDQKSEKRERRPRSSRLSGEPIRFASETDSVKEKSSEKEERVKLQ